jgi:hypothetical protein
MPHFIVFLASISHVRRQCGAWPVLACAAILVDWMLPQEILMGSRSGGSILLSEEGAVRRYIITSRFELRDVEDGTFAGKLSIGVKWVPNLALFAAAFCSLRIHARHGSTLESLPSRSAKFGQLWTSYTEPFLNSHVLWPLPLPPDFSV